MSNIFKSLFTEYGTKSGKSIFGEGFKFLASEARKKFNITAPVYCGVTGGDWGASN